jgi:hypothetical protein
MHLSLLTSSHHKPTRDWFSQPLATILLLASLPLMAKNLRLACSSKTHLAQVNMHCSIEPNRRSASVGYCKAVY